MSNGFAYPVSKPVLGAGGLTGTWRTQKPILDETVCNGCLICWLYCPEAAIARETRAIDYNYCKGCGICATECARGAIHMEKEDGQ